MNQRQIQAKANIYVHNILILFRHTRYHQFHGYGQKHTNTVIENKYHCNFQLNYVIYEW